MTDDPTRYQHLGAVLGSLVWDQVAEVSGPRQVLLSRLRTAVRPNTCFWDLHPLDVRANIQTRPYPV
jgi:hypothetical protein